MGATYNSDVTKAITYPENRVPERIAFALMMLLLASAARGAEVSVAVAANFAGPMKKIVTGFEQTSGHKVLMTEGSTGKFYAQIKAGAPFHILLAADEDTPARLEKEGNAIAGSRFTYAIGKLVLWSAKNTVIDADGNVLRHGGFDHLALANPRLAPYGVAAEETLKSLGLYDTLLSTFVHGESIAQTYQFVATGNALLGFVALSQVIDEGGKFKSGSMWLVPEKYYSPIRQDAVLLAKGKDSTAARALLTYLESTDAQSVIQAYGYALDKKNQTP